MSPIVAILFVILALTSIPLAIASGIASGITLEFFGDLPNSLLLLMQRMVYGVDSYALLAVPLFIFCGKLMNTGGITDRIFDFGQALVGRIPGGLAHANVVASMIFAGMSGASIADAAGLGQIEIKAMTDKVLRSDNGSLRDHWSHHPSEYFNDHLRSYRRGIHRKAILGRHHSWCLNGAFFNG